MTTGKKIRARRKQLGMSVDDLAAKLGKTVQPFIATKTI